MTTRRLCRCGKAIPQERLDILPDTYTCVDCSTETKYLGNVFGTTRHKGFEVEVIRGVELDTSSSPLLRRRREASRSDSLRKNSKKGKPKQVDVPLLQPREDESEAVRMEELDKTICFICKKEHKSLVEYRPFPGVLCPRDRRRAQEGKFVLRRLWSEANESLLPS